MFNLVFVGQNNMGSELKKLGVPKYTDKHKMIYYGFWKLNTQSQP